MRPSQRITGIVGESDGWEVYRRARRLAEAGHAITELTIGEHDEGTDPGILDAMCESARAGNTGYPAIPGSASLRATIARRIEERTGVPTGPDNVLVTPGGQSALFAAHMAVCDPGDTALCIDPFYATYPGTIRAAGARPISVAAQSRDGFRPREGALAEAAPGARSLLVNTPNNPAGCVYDRRTLDGIARVCRDHDLWLISDEVYETQIWHGDLLSPRALPGMASRTLVAGSVSKSHAMTGSRCGWIVGPEDIIARLIDLAVVTTYGIPGFIQDAAEFALAQGRAFEAAIAAPFRRRIALASRILGGGPGGRMLPAEATMYILADIRATGLDGIEFANRLLDDHRIAVMPGESFGRAAAGHIRIALTVRDERLEPALRTLAEFAAALARARTAAT